MSEENWAKRGVFVFLRERGALVCDEGWLIWLNLDCFSKLLNFDYYHTHQYIPVPQRKHMSTRNPRTPVTAPVA